jgi:hypothetical protein
MEVQKETSKIRELKADELDEVTGGFLNLAAGTLAPVGPFQQPASPQPEPPSSGLGDGTSGAGGTYIPDPYGDVYRHLN